MEIRASCFNLFIKDIHELTETIKQLIHNAKF